MSREQGKEEGRLLEVGMMGHIKNTSGGADEYIPECLSLSRP